MKHQEIGVEPQSIETRPQLAQLRAGTLAENPVHIAVATLISHHHTDRAHRLVRKLDGAVVGRVANVVETDLWLIGGDHSSWQAQPLISYWLLP
jgi:hypothetical protein